MITRRHLFHAAGSGFFAFALRHHASSLFAATHSGRAKRCLVLWMQGGPSQLETFDPKPGTDTGGPTKAIATPVPGIAVAESLSKVARHMHDLAIVRNLASAEGEHVRAQYCLHTGHRHVPGFPRPSLGSIVSSETPAADFPKNVTIGGRGFGPAFLGLSHAPFSIQEPSDALEMLRRLKRRRHRLELIETLGERFDREHPDPSVQRRSVLLDQLQTLVRTPFVDALDTSRESAQVRARYGDSPFGQACLLARRLLETGVHFVEVQQDGWDTHNDNFSATKRLCQTIDPPWAALLDDLKASGLLDETLIIWMGEFGRTPNINANGGRDHFPQVTPVVLAGAGIAGGQVVGRTSPSGSAIEGEAATVSDLFATIFAALGIDPEKEFRTEFGAPTSITDGGRVIAPLLSS